MRRSCGLVVVLLAVLVGSSGAGRASAITPSAADYSGSYWVALGHEPAYTLQIVQTDGAVSFSLAGADLLVEGIGEADGRSMTLSAMMEDGAELEATIVFSEQGNSFEGVWEISGVWRARGTLAGSDSRWPEYDVETLGIPRFIDSDAVELAMMRRISRFRSGEGHDYSDDFETCRSMKHYGVAKEGVEHASVRLFSPVDGTIIGTTEEWQEAGESTGTAVGIRPHDHDAFYVAIYHIDLERPLAVGESVLSSQVLGRANQEVGTLSDIAVGLHTPGGSRLVSFFDVMTDQVFARYVARGVGSRNELVISREDRDNDPLTCVDGEFQGPGSLEGWVILEGDAPRPRRPAGRVAPR